MVHDLLLSRNGIAAPVSHPLRSAVTKHKARLSAELTKARLKRGFANLADLKAHVNERSSSFGALTNDQHNLTDRSAFTNGKCPHPKWARVNTLRTTLEVQLHTTFSDHKRVNSIEELLTQRTGEGRILHIDEHVPDLIAFPPSEDLTHTVAYRNGQIILQDKASCFPAYLLGPSAGEGDCLDACAAPGNKTTHMVALMQKNKRKSNARLYACERDKKRANILNSMVHIAGAENVVVMKAGHDFLRLEPTDLMWNKVRSILLDPSCSGSGIVGRDDELQVTLPITGAAGDSQSSRKRKRKASKSERTEKPKDLDVLVEPQTRQTTHTEATEDECPKNSSTRLEALSHIQLKMLLHAFRFPNGNRISYSTCSIHALENEHVVIRALLSPLAIDRGWRILPRDEQVSGMAAWHIRGDVIACKEALSLQDTSRSTLSAQEVAAACIRCEKSTKDGTQGFFVAAFVRRESETHHRVPFDSKSRFKGPEDDNDEWSGLSDSDSDT